MRLISTVFLCLASLAASARAAEQTAVVTESKINVRGQPSLVGEVVTQLQKGDQVTVLDRVQIEKPKADEPTNWAKIKLPANTPVWVFAPMVKNGEVTASRLNLRAGPGENYSVIGRLDRGDKVKAIRTVEQWTEIEAPEGAYAFVDASLIKTTGENPASTTPAPAPTPAAAVASKTEPPPQISEAPKPANPQTNTLAEAARSISKPPVPGPGSSELVAPIVAGSQPATRPETKTEPATPPPAEPAPNPVAASPAVTAPAPATVLASQTEPPAAKTEAPRRKRIVRREGIIRPTISIQAPTWYELISPETKKTMDFLNAEKLGIKLKEYKGQKVVVSGEEGIDSRWPSTPILEMETLDVVP